MSTGPLHSASNVLTLGAPLEEAHLAAVMIHGRGASAEDILTLAQEIHAYEAEVGRRSDICYLAPQATGNTWYPFPFTVPLEQNEPWLSSALGVISSLFERLGEAGIPPERTLLLGFSQGACLALEWAARNPRRLAGLVGLSGGLIGPAGTPRDYPGLLAGTPVFLGCSDVDPHIPKERVLETGEVLKKMGGEVETRLYPNMGHFVNQDEIQVVRGLLLNRL